MGRSGRSPPPLPLSSKVRGRDCTERSIARARVTICIDGDKYEACEKLSEGICDVRKWCEEGGMIVDVSEIFGPGRKVYTTRAGGALDVEIKYKERILKFLVQGRNLYIRGWEGRGKVFELNCGNQKENFTLDKKCIRLTIGLNYHDLIPKGVGEVPTGLYRLREAFDRLWKHAGGEKLYISEDIAIISAHILEPARFPYICRYICKSFTQDELSKLGKDPTNVAYVKNYSKVSEVIMKNIDLMKGGKEPLPIMINGLESKSMDDLLEDVAVLFRDGHNEKKSNFEHEDPPEVPIYENTMADINEAAKKKINYHQQRNDKQKKPKGGGGPKGGGAMGGGRGRGSPSFFHTLGSSHGGSLAPLHTSAGGTKSGLGRPYHSFHPTGAGLKDLLGDQSFSAVQCSKTMDTSHYGLPCYPKKLSDVDHYMSMLSHSKMWIPLANNDQCSIHLAAPLHTSHSFHPTGAGLKDLLGDQSFSAVQCSKTMDISHYGLPCYPKKLSDVDHYMRMLSHSKMWIPLANNDQWAAGSGHRGSHSFSHIIGSNHGGSLASIHTVARGPNRGFGRPEYHPTRAGLKDLLGDHPLSFSMSATVECLKAMNISHYDETNKELPSHDYHQILSQVVIPYRCQRCSIFGILKPFSRTLRLIV